MQLDEAKEKFTQSWGTLGSSWGINRTMAQIHALLLVTNKPLSAEDIMASLQISRGNANMNLRALMDWGLVHKEFKSGERREFFTAEKDIWEVARRIIAERKKREIEPVSRVLDEVAKVEGKADDPEVQEFREMIKSLQDFVHRMDRLTETAAKSDRSWFYKALMKVLTR
jgi:DNA-binding transcriptional regulator GbsR (MarR family)